MKEFENKNILVVGETGSGKSTFADKLVVDFILENSYRDLKLILIDPKQVQFSVYEGIPHLLTSIIYEIKKARNALIWLNQESLHRLEEFKKYDCSSIYDYNRKTKGRKMERIFVIIDELSDLMFADKSFFEDFIGRIINLSSVTGIYLIAGTSRLSPQHVITKKVLKFFPNRVCFKVQQRGDSIYILGESGAENLSSPREFFIKKIGSTKIKLLQMPYINDKQIIDAVDLINKKFIEDGTI